MPFDWKTPFGYLIALLCETSAFYSTVLVCVPLICILVGPCILFMSMAKDITDELRLLDGIGETNRCERRIKERFCHVVQMFADVKQLISEFNQISEVITTMFFFWTILVICSTLVVVQKELVSTMNVSGRSIKPDIFRIFGKPYHKGFSAPIEREGCRHSRR